VICHVFEQCLVRRVVLAQLGLYVRNQQGVIARRRRLDRVFQGCGHRRRRRRLSSRRHDDGRRLGRYRLDHGSRHFSDRLHDGLGSSRLFSNRHWLGLDRYRLGDRYGLFGSDGLDDRLDDGRRLNSSHNRLGLSSDGRRLDRCRLFRNRLDDRLSNRLNDRLSNRLDDRRRLFRNRLDDGRRLDRCRLFSHNGLRLNGSRLFSHNGRRLDDRLFDCGNRLRRDINSSIRGSISSLGGHDNFSSRLCSSRLFSHTRLNGRGLFSCDRLNGRGLFSSRRLGSRGLGGRRFFSCDRLGGRRFFSCDRLGGRRFFSCDRLNGRRLGGRRLFSHTRLGGRRLGGRRFGGRIDRSCFVSHVASFG
jgi:hypothetical protein